MQGIETALLYLTLGMGVLLSAGLLMVKDRVRHWYMPTTASLLLVEGAYIGVRWAGTGHPPIFGTFESTLSASWILVLFALLLDRKGRFARLVIPFSALTFIYGLNFDSTGKPLVISEQSYWVYFHALFAWIAYGFYIYSFAGACTMLAYNKAESDESLNMYAFTHKTVLNGFFAQTIMFVMGSYYSIRLHGSWWIWDPVEFLFVVSWGLYALAMHGKILFGWEQQRIARLIVLAMIGTMLLYWGIIYFPWSTYHIFDTNIKVHF